MTYTNPNSSNFSGHHGDINDGWLALAGIDAHYPKDDKNSNTREITENEIAQQALKVQIISDSDGNML